MANINDYDIKSNVVLLEIFDNIIFGRVKHKGKWKPCKWDLEGNNQCGLSSKFNLYKQKSELDIMKERYESGEYIGICNFGNDKFQITNYFIHYLKNSDYKIELIHKKHKHILDAYLKDNSITILAGVNKTPYMYNWIEHYDENMYYELEQQYPIFKRSNDSNNIFKFDSSDKGVWVLHCNPLMIGYDKSIIDTVFMEQFYETIPYDKERGLYHLQPVFVYTKEAKQYLITFYDAKLNGVIDADGEACGTADLFIEPITTEQLKTMPFVWGMYKEILKDINNEI